MALQIQAKPGRRHGRNKLDPAKRLNALLAFNVTDSDRERIYEYCNELGVVPAAWIRELILAAVKGEPK